MFVIQISDEENYGDWVTVSLSYLHFPLITTVILNTPTILNHSKEKQACTFTMNPWTFPKLVAESVFPMMPISLVPTNAQRARLSLQDEYHGQTLTATDISRVFCAYQRHGPVPHLVYWALREDHIWGDLDAKQVSTVSLSTLEALLATSGDVSDPANFYVYIDDQTRTARHHS